MEITKITSSLLDTKVALPASEKEWLDKNIFTEEFLRVEENTVRCAVANCKVQGTLVVMVGGVPRDEKERKNLPLINTFFGHLAESLKDSGIASVLYNHPGTGLSTGDWGKETLNTRSSVLAQVAGHYYKKMQSLDVAIVGVSAGGYMAVQAMRELQNKGVPVSKLILISPAAYPKTLLDVPYGDAFTKMIRTPWDFTTSPIFNDIKKFTTEGGTSFISFFEDDDPPIPMEVQKSFMSTAEVLNATGKNIEVAIIMGAAHNFRNVGEEKRTANIGSIFATVSYLVSFLAKK